jgi:hypothetical protein
MIKKSPSITPAGKVKGSSAGLVAGKLSLCPKAIETKDGATFDIGAITGAGSTVTEFTEKAFSPNGLEHEARKVENKIRQT